MEECSNYFGAKYGMHGIIGCVDGTHIQIIRPNEFEALYVNRKNKHSLNVMVISDHKCRIRYINAKFAGSNHDAFVWNRSLASTFFEANQHRFNNPRRYLLGIYFYLNITHVFHIITFHSHKN